MDVSISFSNNQIHTQHPWRLGRRGVRFTQREEMEAQLQWLISLVQRPAKGCLVLVEGTWFDEQGVLSDLSRVADSVTVNLSKCSGGGGHHNWTQRGARLQRE